MYTIALPSRLTFSARHRSKLHNTTTYIHLCPLSLSFQCLNIVERFRFYFYRLRFGLWLPDNDETSVPVATPPPPPNALCPSLESSRLDCLDTWFVNASLTSTHHYCNRSPLSGRSHRPFVCQCVRVCSVVQYIVKRVFPNTTHAFNTSPPLRCLHAFTRSQCVFIRSRSVASDVVW